MPFPIITPRLVLRHFTLADAPAFARYRSDPEVARYQGWDAPYSLAQAERFAAEMQCAVPATPGEWFQAAVTLRDSEDLMGDCAFVLLASDPRQAEIGFTLAPQYQRQSIATEALEALLAYLFGELGLHRVRANCDPRNEPSVRLLARLGLRFEGRWRESLWYKGAWSDEDWYALLASEYFARSG
jgi:RimJ/RimL family protein N-acetyltransferase